MPREVTIALVQMAPALANPEANLRKMGDFRDWRIVRCAVNVQESVGA